MERTDLSGIVNQLREQRQKLVEQSTRLEAELKAVTGELGKIDDALSALRSNGKAKAKPNRPSPNRDVVRIAVEACLRDQGTLHIEALKEHVGKRLMADGFSRSGLALRIKEVLQEEAFAESDGRYHVAGNDSTDQHQSSDS